MADSAIRRYESDRGNPTFETLQRIAEALGTTADFLVGGVSKNSHSKYDFWDAALEMKLSRVGFSIGFFEDDADLWLNYPDGTLAVTDAELKALDAETDAYLRFKLQELKAHHPERFKPTTLGTASTAVPEGGGTNAIHKEENK